jgi:hypothetical protein
LDDTIRKNQVYWLGASSLRQDLSIANRAIRKVFKNPGEEGPTANLIKFIERNLKRDIEEITQEKKRWKPNDS